MLLVCTFLQTWEFEKLHKSEIVSRNQHVPLVMCVHSVDIICIRVLFPDPVDLISQDTGKCVPVDAGNFLSVCYLLPS